MLLCPFVSLLFVFASLLLVCLHLPTFLSLPTGCSAVFIQYLFFLSTFCLYFYPVLETSSFSLQANPVGDAHGSLIVWPWSGSWLVHVPTSWEGHQALTPFSSKHKPSLSVFQGSRFGSFWMLLLSTSVSKQSPASEIFLGIFCCQVMATQSKSILHG